MVSPIQLRKSPIVIIKDLMLIQVVAFVAYLLVAVIANYGEIYRGLTVSQFVPYDVARFLFLTIAEMILTSFVGLRWFLETYTIYPDRIIHNWGVLWRHKRILTLHKPVSVTSTAGPISKFFKYGKITIDDVKSGETITLHNIAKPEYYINQILHKISNQPANAVTPLNQLELDELLTQNEHEQLEFKSSLRWDIRANRFNRELEYAVMKTIGAFFNSRGGYIVIGVDDRKQPIGLTNDYQTLPRKDRDGFENHFTQIFNQLIGPEFRQFVNVCFHSHSGHDICVIRVQPSPKPVYLKIADNSEAFYVRTGNTTTPLKLSEVVAYVKTRWQE